MSKRTRGLARRKNDGYDTPKAAVSELLKHLLPGLSFIEPCAGRGDLCKHLYDARFDAVGAFDIEPREGGLSWITKGDATTFRLDDVPEWRASCFITNPPWTRELLHPIIENLSNQLPTWLLFDSDWAVNATPPKYLLDRCERIVAQGRVRWLEGHPDDKGHGSVDNCCWYRFDATHTGGPRWFNRRGKKA